jgi:hypothetical protein
MAAIAMFIPQKWDVGLRVNAFFCRTPLEFYYERAEILQILVVVIERQTFVQTFICFVAV